MFKTQQFDWRNLEPSGSWRSEIESGGNRVDKKEREREREEGR